MKRIHREAGFGSATLLIVIVLGAIAAGAWNYHRNWKLEQANRAARPLAGYETADLEVLAEAYRSEIAGAQARYQGARAQRSAARERGYFDEQVREFEKVQREASRRRDAGGDVAEREAALRDVESELASRAGDVGGWQLHGQRLVRF